MNNLLIGKASYRMFNLEASSQTRHRYLCRCSLMKPFVNSKRHTEWLCPHRLRYPRNKQFPTPQPQKNWAKIVSYADCRTDIVNLLSYWSTDFKASGNRCLKSNELNIWSVSNKLLDSWTYRQHINKIHRHRRKPVELDQNWAECA